MKLEEIYFTDIVYIPNWEDQLLKLKKAMLQHLAKCTICGKELSIDDYLLFGPEYCPDCRHRLEEPYNK